MSTCYAALEDTVFRASDRRDWKLTRIYEDVAVEALAADSRRSAHVYVGTAESGLLRSTDGGESWESVGEFTSRNERVTAITPSPHDPETVWAGTEPSAVYCSRDGGDMWTSCQPLTVLPSADRWSFPPRPDSHHVRNLAVHPSEPDRLYVAIEAGAFVRTTDGGETWIEHPAGARRDNHTIVTHTAVPDRVYVAAGDGYAESPDAGTTWSHPETGLDHRYVWGLGVDPGDPETVLVSAARGARRAHNPTTAHAVVYRREGDGPWTPAMDGLPGPDGLTRPVFGTDGAGEFFALSNLGLFRSGDSGRTWSPLVESWPEAFTQQVARGLAVVDDENRTGL